MSAYEQQIEKLKESVESWRVELEVPGLTYGVFIDGEAHSTGAGVTSVENPLPVTDETLFQIGSVTKTVTATAMMRLVDQGKLDLDAPVRNYLPDFRVADSVTSEQVRVRQLLTHVAGWTGDVFIDNGNGDDAAQKYVEGMATFRQLAPLGTVFSYNNASFCVAACVIEVLTERPFEEAITNLIFEPLGMERSFFFPHQVMLHRFAVGHQAGSQDSDQESRILSPWAIPRGMNGAGGISCHIGDLLRYGAYHLGQGPPLLRSETLQQMHIPHAAINSYMGSVGLSWIISSYDGRSVLWHGGGTNGQNSVLALVPDRRLALGMMTNGQKGDKLNDRFKRAVLREFCGIDVPEPEVIASSEAELAQYAGTYEGTMRRIELRMEGGALLADIRITGAFPSAEPAPEPTPAAVGRCADDQLLVLDGDYEGTRGDIIRDETGAIRYLRFGSRINVRQ